MKQEYQFTISRTDRIYLILFVSVLMSWELIKYALTSPPITITEVSGHVENVTNEKPDFTKRKSNVWKNSPGKKYTFQKSESQSSYTQKEKHPVNIMEASQAELQTIGFSAKVANNITRYRDAGGALKKKEDILKIYGMDDDQWDVVSPYVVFPIEPENYRKDMAEKPKTPIKIIDLNMATETDLESMPGIGSTLAARIIKFRNGLGGFYSMDQLSECYGIPTETIDRITPMLQLTTPVQPQNINTIEWENFMHPYLSSKQKTMLKAYLKNHGPVQTVDELRKIYPPDSTWCDRWLPYIVFE